MLNIEMEFIKGILFIRLDGKLNCNTCSKLYNEISEMINDNGIRNIVFNLNNITEMDLQGFNALIYNYKLCKKNKGESILCNINNKIKPYIVSKTLNNIPIVNNELAALNIFNI